MKLLLKTQTRCSSCTQNPHAAVKPHLPSNTQNASINKNYRMCMFILIRYKLLNTCCSADNFWNKSCGIKCTHTTDWRSYHISAFSYQQGNDCKTLWPLYCCMHLIKDIQVFFSLSLLKYSCLSVRYMKKQFIVKNRTSSMRLWVLKHYMVQPAHALLSLTIQRKSSCMTSGSLHLS